MSELNDAFEWHREQDNQRHDDEGPEDAAYDLEREVEDALSIPYQPLSPEERGHIEERAGRAFVSDAEALEFLRRETEDRMRLELFRKPQGEAA